MYMYDFQYEDDDNKYKATYIYMAPNFHNI